MVVGKIWRNRCELSRGGEKIGDKEIRRISEHIRVGGGGGGGGAEVRVDHNKKMVIEGC